MKKAIVLLLALAVVGGVFAQDAKPALTFGMYGEVNIGVAAVDSYGVYTETYLAYKAKDMGLAATVVGGADFFAAPRNYSLWYQVCPAAKVYAGKLREGPARLASYIDGNGFSTRLANVAEGWMLELKPLAGLTIASFSPVTGVAIVDDLAKSNIGVSYAVPNLATVVASYRMAGNKELAIGVDVKAVKDLTARIGFVNLGVPAATQAKNYVVFTAGKKMGNLNLGLDGNVGFGSFYYGVRGMVEYTMGKYILGARASFDTEKDYWGYSANGFWGRAYIRMLYAAGSIRVAADYSPSGVKALFDFYISY